jgi:hypothetical protein
MAGDGVDDIAGLSLGNLTLSPPGATGVDGELLVDEDLTVNTLTVVASTSLEVVSNGQPDTLTITGSTIDDGTIFTDPSTIVFEGTVILEADNANSDGSGNIFLGGTAGAQGNLAVTGSSSELELA